MVQCHQPTPVVDQRVTDPPRRRSDISGDVHPVRVGLLISFILRADVDMDVAGVGMLNDTAIIHIRALMGPDIGLGMNPGVHTIKMVYIVADLLFHRF